MGRYPLGEERNEVLRTLLRKMIATDYGGSGRAAARAIGVSPTSLSDFLHGDIGAGMKLLDGLSKVLRRSTDQILASNGDLDALRAQVVIPATAKLVSFGELPNWLELQGLAATMRPQFPPWVWSALAESQVWLTVPVTVQLVVDLAEVLIRHVPPPAPSSV